MGGVLAGDDGFAAAHREATLPFPTAPVGAFLDVEDLLATFPAGVAFRFAHRARCAAAMRAFPPALMTLFFGVKSEGLKLVDELVEPFGRTGARFAGASTSASSAHTSGR